MLNSVSSIARDTQDAVSSIHELDGSFDGGSKSASFDVKALYPSIPQAAVVVTVRELLTSFSMRNPQQRWGLLVETICEFISIIFDAHLAAVHLRSRSTRSWFLQKVGVTTGLACGPQFANAFLTVLDRHLVATLRENISFYMRYIDHILIFFRDIDLSEILNEFNCWNDMIKITCDD